MFLFIAPLSAVLPAAGRCVCALSPIRPLSSAVLPHSVHFHSLESQRRTVLQSVFKSHERQRSTNQSDGSQGGGGQRDGRPLCPRCGEPFTGVFSTMSKLVAIPPPPQLSLSLSLSPSFQSIIYASTLLSHSHDHTHSHHSVP